MSSSEPNLSTIPVLHGQTNYREWSLEVKATAQLGGFWKAIVGTNTTTSTDPSEVDKIEQREQMAVGLIMKTVSRALKADLSELQITPTTSRTTPRDPTAKELWDYLKAKFEKKEGVSALNLGSLTQTKLDPQVGYDLSLLADDNSRAPLNPRTQTTVDGRAALETETPPYKEFYSLSYSVPWYRQRKWRVFILIGVILIIIGVVVGGVLSGPASHKSPKNESPTTFSLTSSLGVESTLAGADPKSSTPIPESSTQGARLPISSVGSPA